MIHSAFSKYLLSVFMSSAVLALRAVNEPIQVPVSFRPLGLGGGLGMSVLEKDCVGILGLLPPPGLKISGLTANQYHWIFDKQMFTLLAPSGGGVGKIAIILDSLRSVVEKLLF